MIEGMLKRAVLEACFWFFFGIWLLVPITNPIYIYIPQTKTSVKVGVLTWPLSNYPGFQVCWSPEVPKPRCLSLSA